MISLSFRLPSCIIDSLPFTFYAFTPINETSTTESPVARVARYATKYLLPSTPTIAWCVRSRRYDNAIYRFQLPSPRLRI